MGGAFAWITKERPAHGERWLILILSLTYGVAIKVCLLNNSLFSFGITALTIVGLYLVLYIGTERRKKRG